MPFKPELRQQLRDDLLTTVGRGLREHLAKAMRDAMQEALDDVVEEHVFEAIDKLLDGFLSDEDMDCWISFDAGGPHVLIGIGPGDCAASFTPELGSEFANEHFVARTQEDRTAVGGQIDCIRDFMAILQKQLVKLELAAAAFDGMHAVRQ